MTRIICDHTYNINFSLDREKRGFSVPRKVNGYAYRLPVFQVRKIGIRGIPCKNHFGTDQCYSLRCLKVLNSKKRQALVKVDKSIAVNPGVTFEGCKRTCCDRRRRIGGNHRRRRKDLRLHLGDVWNRKQLGHRSKCPRRADRWILRRYVVWRIQISRGRKVLEHRFVGCSSTK